MSMFKEIQFKNIIRKVLLILINQLICEMIKQRIDCNFRMHFLALERETFTQRQNSCQRRFY